MSLAAELPPKAVKKSAKAKNSSLERSKHGGSQESLLKKGENPKNERARQQMRARFQVLLQGGDNEGTDGNEVLRRTKKQRTRTAEAAVSELRSQPVEKVRKSKSAENLLSANLHNDDQVDGQRRQRDRSRSPKESKSVGEEDGFLPTEKPKTSIKKGKGRILKARDQNSAERPSSLNLESSRAEEAGKENQAYDVSPDRQPVAATNEAVKIKKKKSKRKTLKESLSDRIVRAMETKRRDDAQLLGIEIHKADRLKPDIYISHPVVRIHVIDSERGQYVKKSDRQRNVSSYYETKNESVDYVLPQMTQPFDFKKQRSLTPVWDELLIYNEIYSYFLQREPNDPKAILVFELLDFVSMSVVSRKENPSLNKGWHKIAWAFLKIVGADGSLNTDRKVRLQLYDIPTHMNTRNMILGSTEVFQWWSSGIRHPYPSTLYVTIKGIRPPSDVPPSTRSMFPIQEERGRLTYEEFSSSVDAQGVRLSNQVESKNQIIWSRLPGQLNRIPNKLSLSLPSGRKGCSVVRFSSLGRFLACACTTADGYPIIVYKIPSGELHAEFSGHFGIVYDMSWSANDQDLVTASSDGTARGWNGSRGVKSSIKIFPHPSFVYAVKHHPRRQSIIVTGGYDSVVRIWRSTTEDINGELLKTLAGHGGYVNCICFNEEGNSFFTADSNGSILEWRAPPDVQGTKDRAKGNADMTLVEKWGKIKTLKVEELKGTAISSMKLHPSGKKLLLHTKNGTLQMLDLRTFLVMKRYYGAINFKDHLRSTLSTCGSLVFGSSEDGMPRVWNTETGDLVYTYKALGYNGAVNDVDFHPMDNYVCFCSFGSAHPIIVYSYDPTVGVIASKSPFKSSKGQELLSNTTFDSPVTALTMQNSARISSSVENLRTKLLEELHTPLPTVSDTRSFRKSEAEPSFLIPDRVGESMGLTRSTWGSEFSHHDATVNPANETRQPFMRSPSPHAQQHLGASTRLRGLPHGGISAPYSIEGSQNEASASRRPPSHKKLPVPILSSTQKPSMTEGSYPRVVAMYEYRPNRADELHLNQGDVITVLQKHDSDWWLGQQEDGRRGLFPANYIMEVEDGVQFENEFYLNPGTPLSRQHSAVISHDGELKILSGPEDNEEGDTTRSVRRKRKQRRKDPAI